MNSEYQNTKDRENLIEVLSGKIIEEIIDEYPDVKVSPVDNTLAEAILEVYRNKLGSFIVIIDEYDVLIREQVERELLDSFLGFLNGLFKSDTLRPAISLAYLTGILPIVRDKVQSKLNNFEEYTILDAAEFTEFVGFTSKEVMDLCNEQGISFEECRNWYDGYSQNGYEIYNPESVVKSLKNGKFEGYWGKTSSYTVISDRIRQNFKGLKECIVKALSGEKVEVNVTRYLNTMDSFKTKDDSLTYLIHVGYLAYDSETGTCRIPNREVRQEWFNAIEDDENYETTDEIIKASKELLTETLSGNEEAVAEALDKSHIHVSGNRSYNNKDVLQSAIYLAYIYALNDYECFREVTAGSAIMKTTKPTAAV